MKLKRIVLVVANMSLVACGGGSSETPPSNSVVENSSLSTIPLQIKAVSTTKSALLGEQTEIIVNADADNGQPLKLTNVTPRRSDDCLITNVSGLTYSFINSAVGECVFDYQVEPVSQLYSGVVTSSTRVSVSSTFEPYELPILSYTTYVGSSFTLDLKFSLATEYPTDSTDPYQLDVDNVSIHGPAESAIIFGSDRINPTITISPTDILQAGVTRIAYSLSNSNNTKLGIIDFTVSYSDGVNRKPVARDYIIQEHISLNGLDLDLSTLHDENGEPLVSDADGDIVTLVQSSNYNVSSSSQNNPTLVFSIKPQRSGINYIPYTITDNHGGYDTGLIYVTVAPDFTTVNQLWDDISLNKNSAIEITFTAPLAKTVADMLHVDYSNTNAEIGTTGPKASSVIKMTHNQARDYCYFRQGRLPTTTEIERLIDSRNGSLYSNDNWPTGVEFWTADMATQENAYVYNLHTGQQSTEDVNSSNYVSCVYLTDTVKPYRIEFQKLREPTDDFNDIHASGNNTYGYVRATVYDPYGEVAPYFKGVINTGEGRLIFADTNNPASITDNVMLQASQGGIFDFVVYNPTVPNVIVLYGEDVYSYISNGRILGQYLYAVDDEGETNEPLYLDIYNTSKWHFYKYEVAKYGNVDERGGIGNGRYDSNSAAHFEAQDQQGLKLWDETDYEGSSWIDQRARKMWAFYILKQPFIGRNFSAKLVFMHRDYENRNSSLDTMDASVTFSLQQKWTDMSSSPSGQTAQDILGAPTSYHYQNGSYSYNDPVYYNNEKVLPGVGILDDRALTIQMRRKYNDANNIYFSVLNTRNDMVSDNHNNNLGIKGQLEVIWIEYVDGELKIYSAAAREVNDAHMMEKPSTPVLHSTNTTLGSIDPTKPYYLMISQYIFVSQDSDKRDTAFLFALSFKSWE